MAKLMRLISISLQIPGDEDLIELIERLGRGNVGPWIKQVMRKAAKEE